MKAVYAVRCQLAGDPAENLARAWDLAGEWAEESLHFDGLLIGDSGEQLLEDGSRARWRILADGDSEVRRLIVASPRNDGAGAWETRIWVERGQGPVRVTLRSGPVEEEGVVAPLTFHGVRPGVVARWMQELEVFADGYKLSDEPTYVPPAAADQLVAFVQNQGRRLPIVGVTTEGDALPRLNMDRLCHRLGGLAHVMVIPPGSTWTLTNALGEGLSVWDGGARIWWPRFGLEDAPFFHRRWLPWTIAENPGRVENEIVLRVWRAAVDVLSPPSQEAHLEASLNHQRVMEQVALAREEAGQSGIEDADSWFAELEAVLDENARLVSVVQEQSHDIEELQHRLVQVKDTSPPDAEAPEVDSVEHAVRTAAVESPNVFFTPEAYESAADSEYADAQLVLHDLRVLQRMAARWADGEMAEGWTAAFAEEPVRFQPGISKTARQQYGSDYEIEYSGATVMMGPHLRRGVGAPRSILRIYWYEDSANKILVVGHVGKKLRDASNA